MLSPELEKAPTIVPTIYARIPFHQTHESGRGKKFNQVGLVGPKKHHLYVKQSEHLYLYDLSYRKKSSRIARNLDIDGGPLIILKDGDTYIATQKIDDDNKTMNEEPGAVCNLIIRSIKDEKKHLQLSIAFKEEIKKIVISLEES